MQRHLQPRLGHPEPALRRAVATAIGSDGESAARSLPALEAATADEADEEVHGAPEESVARLTGPRD